MRPPLKEPRRRHSSWVSRRAPEPLLVICRPSCILEALGFPGGVCVSIGRLVGELPVWSRCIVSIWVFKLIRCGGSLHLERGHGEQAESAWEQGARKCNYTDIAMMMVP